MSAVSYNGTWKNHKLGRLSFLIHSQGSGLKSFFCKVAVSKIPVFLICNGREVDKLILNEITVSPEFVKHFPGLVRQPLEGRRQVTRKIDLEKHHIVKIFNNLLGSR